MESMLSICEVLVSSPPTHTQNQPVLIVLKGQSESGQGFFGAVKEGSSGALFLILDCQKGNSHSMQEGFRLAIWRNFVILLSSFWFWRKDDRQDGFRKDWLSLDFCDDS